MCIYKPFNAVLCRQCGVLLDMNLLAIHVKEKHCNALPLTNHRLGMPGKNDFFEAHVKDAFSILQSYLPFQYKTVHRPIPFLLKPGSFLHCPKCKEPFENNETAITEKSFGSHFRTNPTCASSEEVQQIKEYWAEVRPPLPTKENKYAFSKATHRYAQIACRGQTFRRRWIVYCPDGWTPPAPTDMVGASPGRHAAATVAHELDLVTVNIVEQSYAVKLGWDTAFKTKTGDKIDLWKRLMTSFDEEEGEGGQEQKVLERGLLEVREFLYDYLYSANVSVKSCCEIFRRQLTGNGR